MQKEVNSNKTVYFEWQAPVRYYEKKTQTYFRAIVSLGIVLSLLLFFFSEYLLILVVWSAVFVYYMKAAVPPQEAVYKFTKFGLQFYEQTVAFEAMKSFTVTHKPTASVLRIFISSQNPYELHVLLPGSEKKDEIVAFLEQKVPFVETVPKTDIEKFADWLGSFVGLS